MSAAALRRYSGRHLVIVAAGLVLLAALAAFLSPLGRLIVPPPPPRPTSGAPQTYPAALAYADQQVLGAQEVLRTQGEGWLFEERVARAALNRAKLTGSFDDYALAQAALDRAFATAPKGAGPHLTQAVVAFSLHRLAQSQAALDAIDRYAVLPDAETRAEVSAMRGDIAFYRGDYADALRRYQGGPKAVEASFRLAVFQGKTGQVDAALASLEKIGRAERFPTARFLASLELQRGALELQRGAWDKAAAHFAHADRIFPGDWYAQAHLAQMQALQGRTTEAAARLREIAERSNVPEVMDALAAVYRAAGDGANSRLWAERAGTLWAQRLARIPEAAWGHAVEHELAFGSPARALELARLDYAARPYGASGVALAWAYIAANRSADALAALQPVLASRWVSPEQHLAAAQAHLLLGEAEAADAEQQKALALNPHAADASAALIWFGH